MGLKPVAETTGFVYDGSVGERSVSLRRSIVRLAGGIRSEYVSMSSDKRGEKPLHRKSKVS